MSGMGERAAIIAAVQEDIFKEEGRNPLIYQSSSWPVLIAVKGLIKRYSQVAVVHLIMNNALTLSQVPVLQWATTAVTERDINCEINASARDRSDVSTFHESSYLESKVRVSSSASKPHYLGDAVFLIKVGYQFMIPSYTQTVLGNTVMGGESSPVATVLIEGDNMSQIGTSTPGSTEEDSTETKSLRVALKQSTRKRNDAELAQRLRHIQELYKSYKQHRPFHTVNVPQGRGAVRAWQNVLNAKEVHKTINILGRKRSLIESNVEHRAWNSTLVIAWVSLGLLLLMAVFIRMRRRCRKIADIESRALRGTVKLPMEDEVDVKSQTMIEAVEDAPPAY
ncbi:hypothetical protein EV421DRAFT_2000989 [Armillaria borealis]|uniref:Uncharacterized protein n=1 Tax=Armillaria borealis TaxID=47425 RepID=A0AA39IZ85_9AGAR|nr:hypothetical protein EV421DRAFT_2000989 [Armillaria borealis]